MDQQGDAVTEGLPVMRGRDIEGGTDAVGGVAGALGDGGDLRLAGERRGDRIAPAQAREEGLPDRGVQHHAATVTVEVFAAGADVFEQRAAFTGRRRYRRAEALHAHPQPGRQREQQRRPHHPAAQEHRSPQRGHLRGIDQVHGTQAVVGRQHLTR